MAKTLVIAEKPSVGRDLAGALPGSFSKQEGYLESDDTVITWAVGHLVQLAEPEQYDERFKRWRMDDLPIVPEAFRLIPRDAKSKKQLKVIEKLLTRDDVDVVINACDAGRSARRLRGPERDRRRRSRARAAARRHGAVRRLSRPVTRLQQRPDRSATGR